MEQYQNYINGQFKDSNKKFHSINPTTEEPWAEISAAGKEDVNDAVKAASDAFHGEWSEFLPQQRSKVLRAIGDKLLENAELLKQDLKAVHITVQWVGDWNINIEYAKLS